MKGFLRTAVAVIATVGIVGCGPNARSDRDKDARGTSGVVDTAKDAADKAGDKASSAVSSAGEAMTDAWITATLNTKFLGEDALKDSDINVDTSNNVVTLKGLVRSSAGRARAVEVAKGTEGVVRVVDELKIVGSKK